MAGLAYAMIVTTSALGYFGAPWWLLLFGVGGLACLAHLELRALGSRFSAVGATYMLEAAAHARLGQSLLAAIAAYVWGALVRYVFGG
jgi:hypothetical protein